MDIPLKGTQGIVRKRLLCGIIVLVCLVMTISLYMAGLRNSFYTLQEENDGGRPENSSVRKIEQVTVSTETTTKNSVRASSNTVTASTTTNSVRDSTTTNSVRDSTTTNSVRDSTTTNSLRDSTTTNSVRESPNIVVYIEMFAELNQFYGNSFTEIEKTSPERCLLPNNSLCIYQHEDKKVDVVFRFVHFYVSNQDNFPFIYHDGQIVAMMNSEAEQEALIEPLKKADIRIDHHIASEITMTEACAIPWREGMYETPDPSKRKGIAVFVSNCNAQWRTDYILELAKHIHIDSYGKCWHNVSDPPDSEHRTIGFDPAKKYRMMITFENTINHDYITEKIWTSYHAGAIPVYWGPPEIYLWTPGNHTFIDPQRFKGPKELAEYLRRVDEDDDLFRHHTTNFNYSIARKTHMENCPSEPYWCQICTLAHKMKMNRGK